MNYLQKIEQARDLIRQSVQEYQNIVLGSSFGKDSMVLLHLVLSVKPNIPVFGIVSDTEFSETYEFIRNVVLQYHLNYTEYSFKQHQGKKCCGDQKVEKAQEAVKGYDAWFSGIRKTEGITRVNFQAVEEKDGLIKINPILELTELDIWRYIALNNVPINPIYKKGYRSLSCARCSVPEEDETETEREGRWKGTPDHRGECGIHTTSLRRKINSTTSS